MDSLKTIEGKVRAVLQENEDARNDDMVLYLALCNLYLKDAGAMPLAQILLNHKELGFFAADYYGRGSQKFPYSYDDFYAASTDKKCDIFRCVENGRLYVPCQYELQQYMDGKQKERRNAYER